MAMNRKTRTLIDYFDRAQAITTTPGHNGWTIRDTSATGTPTYAVATGDGGGLRLLLTSTSEAQIVTLYQNDVLCFDVRQIQNVWWIAKVAGVDSVTTIVAGVGSASPATHTDPVDNVATNAWFRIEGSASTSNVVVETDDATTDNDDKATGTTLAATEKKLLIDFTAGISDVKFYIDGARVAAGTTFNMSALAAGLNVQPFVQLQKGSGTGVPEITLVEFGITYNRAHGA